ncbi:ATP/GTP-binding protein [Streptomyces sp. NPDC050161]|uniref:ATP/GTP-binding protein n=1 Tax=Streptomyces sp. NPDC050161 TaxID=3365604 RepID=UPI0037B82661
MLRRAPLVFPLAVLLSWAGGAPALADGPGASVDDCGMSICLGAGYEKKVGGSPEQQQAHKAPAGSAKKPACKAWGDGHAGDIGMGTGPSRPARVAVPCHDSELGSFSGDCYYKPASPPPPADDPAWKGHKPGDGAVYQKTCPLWDNNDPFALNSQGLVWMAKPPGAGAVDPVRLAEQAVDKMALKGPQIVSPRSGGTFTVGVPVWMHVAPSATTYGPNSASASAGGVTVTADARVSEIDWSMGDGSTVTCQGPGSSYQASYGLKKSPDCGHLYQRTSRSGESEKFVVRATATWKITWTGAGQSGELTRTRNSQVEVRVGEVQAVGR